jgi:hypothetical protein
MPQKNKNPKIFKQHMKRDIRKDNLRIFMYDLNECLRQKHKNPKVFKLK